MAQRGHRSGGVGSLTETSGKSRALAWLHAAKRGGWGSTVRILQPVSSGSVRRRPGTATPAVRQSGAGGADDKKPGKQGLPGFLTSGGLLRTLALDEPASPAPDWLRDGGMAGRGFDACRFRITSSSWQPFWRPSWQEPSWRELPFWQEPFWRELPSWQQLSWQEQPSWLQFSF